MRRANPKALIEALVRAFPKPVPSAPWLDKPAALYALAVAESADLDLNTDVLEPDGTHSVSLWSINQGQWGPKIGYFPSQAETAKMSDSGLLDLEVSYLAKKNGPVSALIDAMLPKAVAALQTRIDNGERNIKWNACFDAPLMVSLAWQYGAKRVIQWMATSGAHAGEIGFQVWYDAQGFKDKNGNKVTVIEGYTRRQKLVRAFYGLALGVTAEIQARDGRKGGEAQIIEGLKKATSDTGVDYLTSIEDGFLRLYQLTGSKDLIEDGQQYTNEIRALTGIASTGVGLLASDVEAISLPKSEEIPGSEEAGVSEHYSAFSALTAAEQEIVGLLSRSIRVFNDFVEEEPVVAGAGILLLVGAVVAVFFFVRRKRRGRVQNAARAA